jgi:hypothetical protein
MTITTWMETSQLTLPEPLGSFQPFIGSGGDLPSIP